MQCIGLESWNRPARPYANGAELDGIDRLHLLSYRRPPKALCQMKTLSRRSARMSLRPPPQILYAQMKPPLDSACEKLRSK